MYLGTVLALFSTLGMAFAQSNSTNSTNVVTIQVGGGPNTPGGMFQYIPNNVTATNGTVVNFRFTGMPGNHSVTQAAFDAPCQPMSGGFDSGWVFLPDQGLQPIPEWNLTITNDQEPIYFYCKQLEPQHHCSTGMVGAINPPSTGNTLDSFLNAAKGVSNVPQVQNGLVGVGASASARPGPLPSSAMDFPTGSVGTSAPAAPSSTSPSGATGLSVGLGLVGFVAVMTNVLLA